MQLLGRRICHVFVAGLIKRLLSVFSIDARFMRPSVHPSMCPVDPVCGQMSCNGALSLQMMRHFKMRQKLRSAFKGSCGKEVNE